MKKEISVLLLTMMCAIVFAGCGESKGATEPYSVAKFNMLHNSKLPLNCNVNTLIQSEKLVEAEFSIPVKRNSAYVSDEYVFQTIGDIVIDGEITYVALDDEVFSISYDLSDNIDVHKVIMQLSETYGKYNKSGSIYTWHLALPDNNDWQVILFSEKDPVINADKKVIRFNNQTAQKIIQDEHLVPQ